MRRRSNPRHRVTEDLRHARQSEPTSTFDIDCPGDSCVVRGVRRIDAGPVCNVPGFAFRKQLFRPEPEYWRPGFTGAAGFDLLRDLFPGFPAP